MFRGPIGPHCVRRPKVGVFGPWPIGAPEIGSYLRGSTSFGALVGPPVGQKLDGFAASSFRRTKTRELSEKLRFRGASF